MDHISRLLRPPTFPDRENTRTAYWLNLILLLCIISLVAMTVFLPLSPVTRGSSQEFFIWQIVLMGLFIGDWILMRVGFVRLAAFFFLAAIYSMTVFSLVFIVHTVSDPSSLIGFFVLVPATGLLFGRKPMIGVVILTVISLSIIFVLELSAM